MKNKKRIKEIIKSIKIPDKKGLFFVLKNLFLVFKNKNKYFQENLDFLENVFSIYYFKGKKISFLKNTIFSFFLNCRNIYIFLVSIFTFCIFSSFNVCLFVPKIMVNA